MEAAEKAIEILSKLSEDKIKAAIYFLELLALKEEIEATEEILNDEELITAIRRSRKAKAEGIQEEFVSWEALQACQ